MFILLPYTRNRITVVVHRGPRRGGGGRPRGAGAGGGTLGGAPSAWCMHNSGEKLWRSNSVDTPGKLWRGEGRFTWNASGIVRTHVFSASHRAHVRRGSSPKYGRAAGDHDGYGREIDYCETETENSEERTVLANDFRTRGANDFRTRGRRELYRWRWGQQFPHSRAEGR